MVAPIISTLHLCIIVESFQVRGCEEIATGDKLDFTCRTRVVENTVINFQLILAMVAEEITIGALFQAMFPWA